MTNKRYRQSDYTIIQLLPEDLDTLMEMQEIIYDAGMREDRATLEALFGQNAIQLGLIMEKKLVGFLMTTTDYSENNNYLFIWDIAILPDFQKRGLGTYLLRGFLKEARKKGISVGLACRNTSLPMFSKGDTMKECGYHIAECRLEPDGYFKYCGVHEDMYHIELEPAAG